MKSFVSENANENVSENKNQHNPSDSTKTAQHVQKNKKMPPTFPKAGKISGNFPKSSQNQQSLSKNQQSLSPKQAKINTDFRNSHRRKTRENFCLFLVKSYTGL